MTSAKPLLKRLEFPSRTSVRRLPGDIDELVDAVRQHLQQILNSRHGNAQTVPDYGTSDFSDFFRGYDSTHRIKEEIQHSIEKYEPRLTDVEVSYAPQEDALFTIHFDIVAKLVSEEIDAPATFRTIVESTGKVRVK